MATTPTYDAKQQVIRFGNLNLTPGLVSIVVKRANEIFKTFVCADGRVIRSKINDNTATVEIEYDSTNPINEQLSNLAASDMSSTNGAGVAMYHQKDLSATATVVHSEDAWISTIPDLTRGAEVQTLKWIITLANMQIVHGGNN